MNPVSFYLLLFEFCHKLPRDWVDCVMQDCRLSYVVGAELIKKTFYKYSLVGCLLCFVSAFFLKAGMRKRSTLSREAICFVGNSR